jgi:hypothetical protein
LNFTIMPERSCVAAIMNNRKLPLLTRRYFAQE